MAAFRLDIERELDCTLLQLFGDADLEAQDALSLAVTRIVATHPRLVILDLSAVTMIASLAVGQILQLYRGLKNRGGSLRLVAPTPDVLDVFVRCRLTELLPVFDSVAAARSDRASPEALS
jgi:anti-anti-sigma factor